MSEEEDDNKYINNKNNNISENEEEENEQEEEEENEEIEEDTNNNNNKNKKKDNNKSIKNSENEKEDESEHTEKQNDIKINIKKNNKNILKNNINKKELEYIAQIEELENEIKLEKNINKKLKNIFNPDDITQLKNDLDQKNTLLEKLIATHKKQKYALNILTKQLDKENKKRMKIKSPEIKRNNNDEDSDRSEKILSKKEAIDIVLKVKDKELSNATIKMNLLKSENDGLKKILYENEDYNNNINMEDKVKEMNDKIEKFNIEKSLLLKQLKLHKKCIEEQKEYNEEYENLKEELKQTKKNIQTIRSQTLKLINNNEKKNASLNNNKLYLGLQSLDNINNNRYNYGTISTPNIHNKIKIKNQKKEINNKIIKNTKGIVLPLIYSSQNLNQDDSILTDTFTKKIKEYLDNDEDEYTTLITKITNIENSRKLIENKHKSELKQFNTQIDTLKEQFQLLNCDSKGSTCNIRVLKYKLNTIKGDNRQYTKKINELKKELNEKINLSKEKDYEISLLIGQINSLKYLANYDNIEIPQDDISNYIEKIKQEKENEINEKTEEEEEKEKDKKTDEKNVSKMEESIQADFPESENYNEEEEIEEEEEDVKNDNKKK